MRVRSKRCKTNLQEKPPVQLIPQLQDAIGRYNLTLAEVAEALAVSESTVSRWLSDGKKPFRRNAERIERFLASLESPRVKDDPAGYDKRIHLRDSLRVRGDVMVAPKTYSTGPHDGPTTRDCEELLADTLRLAERLPGGIGAAYQKLVLLRAEIDQVAKALKHPAS